MPRSIGVSAWDTSRASAWVRATTSMLDSVAGSRRPSASTSRRTAAVPASRPTMTSEWSTGSTRMSDTCAPGLPASKICRSDFASSWLSPNDARTRSVCSSPRSAVARSACRWLTVAGAGFEAQAGSPSASVVMTRESESFMPGALFTARARS